MWRLAAVLAVLSCYVIATPALASPQQARTAAAQTSLSLSVTNISQRTLRPGARLVLQGQVVNRTGRSLTGVWYRLRHSTRNMVHRGELDQTARADVTRLAGATGARPLGGTGNMAAGGTPIPWQLDVKAADLRFGAFGVYPIGVEFYNAAGQSLAGQVTFAVWQPRGEKPPVTSIGWVWPLADRMHRTSDSTFFDDRLAGQVAADGRLTGLVTAAEKTSTPITWAIDPALLDDARAMTQEYTVHPPGKKAERKPADANAGTWLDRLRTVSRSDSYFALPYADVDADALVRNGQSKHLEVGYRRKDVAAQVLGRSPTSNMAWPVLGVSTTKTLGRMARYGSDTFLMTSSVFVPADETYTPSSPATVNTSVGDRGVVTYDATLSKIVSTPTQDPGDRLLAEQRFLAETAMISVERPLDQRTIVIAPDRHWSPDPVFAQNLLKWTGQAAWLRPARVEDIAKTPPRTQFTYTGYPESFPSYELGRKYLGEVKKIAGRAGGFASILNPPAYPYERAILRMESGSWRGTGMARRARAARGELAEEVDAQIGKVRVAQGRNTIQLAGRSGRVLLTIDNGLDRNIRLQLKITSRNQARLQIGEYSSNIELGPNENATINFEVESYAQGPAQVDVELLTPEGTAYRPPHTLTINTNGYGPVALLITGGSLAVLFVGVGFRAMRARRRNKMEASGDGSPGGEPPWAGDPSGPAAVQPTGPPAERS